MVLRLYARYKDCIKIFNIVNNYMILYTKKITLYLNIKCDKKNMTNCNNKLN